MTLRRRVIPEQKSDGRKYGLKTRANINAWITTHYTHPALFVQKRPLPAGKSRYFEWQMPCSYPLITMITSRKDGFPGRKKPCFTQRFAMFHPAKGHQPHSRQASYASTDSCFGKTGEHCQDDTLSCTIPTSFHDDTNANARQCKQEA